MWACTAMLAACTAAGGMHPGGASAEKVSTGDRDTDAMVVKMQKASSGIEACVASLSMVFAVSDQEVEIRGRGTFRRPTSYRLEKVLPGGATQVVVCSGGLLWLHDAEEQIVSRVNAARVYQATGQEADTDQADPLRPFRGMVWETIRYTRELEVERPGRRIFEATPDAISLQVQLGVPVVKVRVSLDSTDGLLRTVEHLDSDGNAVVTQRFRDVVANPKLAENAFEFVVPAGVHVMDVTEDVIEMLEAARD